MSHKLTIVIPTYNRAEHIQRRMEELLPQVEGRSDVALFVFDDFSKDKTPQTLAPYIPRLTKHERSTVNLGIGRNMLRAFESVNTGWLWTLGDDDPAAPNAVETALDLISKNPDALAINCDSEGGRNSHDYQVRSLQEFLVSKEVADVLFMSSNLYNQDVLKPYWRVFCQALGSLAPHLALMLAVLEDTGRPLAFTTRQLTLPHHHDQRWSSLEVAQGMATLPVFIKDHLMQQEIARSTRRITRWMLRYGLREVTDVVSFLRWKRMALCTDAILEAHGATFWDDFRYAKDDPKIILRIVPTILKRCPYWLVKGLAAQMRKSHAGEQVLFENNVNPKTGR